MFSRLLGSKAGQKPSQSSRDGDERAAAENTSSNVLAAEKEKRQQDADRPRPPADLQRRLILGDRDDTEDLTKVLPSLAEKSERDRRKESKESSSRHSRSSDQDATNRLRRHNKTAEDTSSPSSRHRRHNRPQELDHAAVECAPEPSQVSSEESGVPNYELGLNAASSSSSGRSMHQASASLPIARNSSAQKCGSPTLPSPKSGNAASSSATGTNSPATSPKQAGNDSTTACSSSSASPKREDALFALGQLGNASSGAEQPAISAGRKCEEEAPPPSSPSMTFMEPLGGGIAPSASFRGRRAGQALSHPGTRNKTTAVKLPPATTGAEPKPEPKTTHSFVQHHEERSGRRGSDWKPPPVSEKAASHRRSSGDQRAAASSSDQKRGSLQMDQNVVGSLLAVDRGRRASMED
eukprot:gnl/TRDRNA2_/TRDRNA2_145803_c0_seq1.p1 gnl/TRDRNA2_/TRDRNA2_145803_c0~~gnl/TRDRNA2_/TRDRNA2_145803_c0_seq1.p1  ORF type:complete len:410 (+),score=59.83 gnl/TRDRNA2_/TRDRNA2_145803_c0_seq1:91-1320(+)